MSRNPVLEAYENEDENLKTVNCLKLEDIINDQQNNKEIDEYKNKLVFKNKIYYKKSKRKKEKILITEEFSKKMIENIHRSYCHLGRKQLQDKITPVYTARNLNKNIKEVCEKCSICIKNKSRTKFKIGLMSHLGPATYPFEIMSLDTIGGFGGSRSTKKYLYLMVDHFTR